MIGCMVKARLPLLSTALSGVIDHIDLDSHYNLAPDPAEGLRMEDGITMPSDAIGHGAALKN